MGLINWWKKMTWEKIDELPSWINIPYPRNQRVNTTVTRYVRGKTFIYKIKFKSIYIENHGHGGAIGNDTYYRKLRK